MLKWDYWKNVWVDPDEMTYKPFGANQPSVTVHWSEIKKADKTFLYDIRDYETLDKLVVASVYDCSEKDLNVTHILKVIEAMKSKLAFSTASEKEVDHYECEMTKEVKNMIEIAYKKLEMYGKKPIFIARFDEYLNELPETFDYCGKMTLKLIEPDESNTVYLRLTAIRKKPSWDRIIEW